MSDFEPSHVIDVPPLSVKIVFTMTDGNTFEGTGFCVVHKGRHWLVTCRHNVESRKYDFTGGCDLVSMQLLGESELTFNDDRSVVAIWVGGFIPDCAAIELRDGEWQATPKFDTSLRITMSGETLPPDVALRAPAGVEGLVRVKPAGWVLFQGFPGGSSQSVTLRGVRIVPLPRIIQPWMPSFLPVCVEGFSGGPVLNRTESEVSLLGITTHKFPATLSVGMDDGRTAEISIQASACVPIAPLLWALSNAGPGVSVIEVRTPHARIEPPNSAL